MQQGTARIWLLDRDPNYYYKMQNSAINQITLMKT